MLQVRRFPPAALAAAFLALCLPSQADAGLDFSYSSTVNGASIATPGFGDTSNYDASLLISGVQTTSVSGSGNSTRVTFGTLQAYPPSTAPVMMNNGSVNYNYQLTINDFYSHASGTFTLSTNTNGFIDTTVDANDNPIPDVNLGSMFFDSQKSPANDTDPTHLVPLQGPIFLTLSDGLTVYRIDFDSQSITNPSSDASVDGTFSALITPVTAVPEPASLTLLALGGAGLALWRRRGRRPA